MEKYLRLYKGTTGYIKVYEFPNKRRLYELYSVVACMAERDN